jgi:threonine-phosphate decarboxylase
MSGHGDSLARDFRAAARSGSLTAQVDRRHGGDVDACAPIAGVAPGQILDFSASINPLGPPPSVRKAFIESYNEISRYPDPYGEKLKHALGGRHGVSPAEVLLGNGSTQLIYLICAALRPRTALVVGPAFSEYANALALTDARVGQFSLPPTDGFRFSLPRFMAAWEKDCDIVFLATPNSVTGQLIPRRDLEKIAHAALTRKTLVIVDEAFIDFVEEESVKLLVRRNPYLVVLRSLTKYYSLPGLRLGYLLGAPRRITQLAEYQEPWSVNSPALHVALACLNDSAFEIETKRWLERERDSLLRRLTGLRGFNPIPSQANFLLVKMEGNTGDALQLRSFLLRTKKLLIRACDSFAGLGHDYFRVAVRRRADNRRLIAGLREWSAECSG